MSQREAATQLNVSQPLLNKILTSRFEIERAGEENQNKNRKRKRDGKDKEIEGALREWFSSVREKDARKCRRTWKKDGEKKNSW